jgi:hypothetical protein
MDTPGKRTATSAEVLAGGFPDIFALVETNGFPHFSNISRKKGNDGMRKAMLPFFCK